jgi:ABC-type bacteriocin/lantibiotic exporter with double-glycine peptidase domain
LTSTPKKLAFLLTGFRKRFLSSLIIGGIAVTFDTISLIYFGSLVASIAGESELIDKISSAATFLGVTSNLQMLVGLLFLMYLIKSALLIVFNRSISRFAFDLKNAIQTRLLKGILVDVPYRLLSSNSSALFSNKVMQVAHVFSSELVLQGSIGLINTATGVLIFFYLVVINPQPTLILASAFLVTGLIYTKTMAKPLQKISHNMHQNMSRLTQLFMDSIYSAKDARVHNLQQNYLNLAGGYLSNISQNHIRYNTIQMVPRVTYEILLCLSFLIFTIGSGLSAVSTQNLMTQFSIFLIAAMKMLPAISQILGAVALYNANHSSIDVLYSELKPLDEHLKKSSADLIDTSECNSQWSTIKFSNVSFSYQPEKPILKKVNFTILQGRITGISGPSGEGKSTLLDILLGLLTPDSGSILINDVELALCKQAWNAKIGYMSQNLFLLDASIKLNLTLADSTNTFDSSRAQSCLNEVGLQNFASDDGLELQIGERGGRLSGGQRQRLAIARLLYSQKSVLILDEPTASLDKQAEQAVIQCIQTIKNSKTIIVVSHSEALLKECEYLYEVRNGKVAKSTSYGKVS